MIRILEHISAQTLLLETLATGAEETPIGVICMYSGQKQKLEFAFARHPWEPRFRRLVRIDTVDAYQGKENAIVILSLVRCNAAGIVGHVNSDNRCNVAVSRAQERLIIVGAKEMWQRVEKTTPMRRILDFFASNPKVADIIPLKELS